MKLWIQCPCARRGTKCNLTNGHDFQAFPCVRPRHTSTLRAKLNRLQTNRLTLFAPFSAFAQRTQAMGRIAVFFGDTAPSGTAIQRARSRGGQGRRRRGAPGRVRYFLIESGPRRHRRRRIFFVAAVVRSDGVVHRVQFGVEHGVFLVKHVHFVVVVRRDSFRGGIQFCNRIIVVSNSISFWVM